MFIVCASFANTCHYKVGRTCSVNIFLSLKLHCDISYTVIDLHHPLELGKLSDNWLTVRTVFGTLLTSLVALIAENLMFILTSNIYMRFTYIVLYQGFLSLLHSKSLSGPTWQVDVQNDNSVLTVIYYVYIINIYNISVLLFCIHRYRCMQNRSMLDNVSYIL